MRLWSLHPKYLDPRGLVALWREALLAQAVLRGLTRGYRHHPQLERFRAHPRPRSAINAYLACVHAEAETRGYRFDRRKCGRCGRAVAMKVTSGQLGYEWQHLLAKLRRRSPADYRRWKMLRRPDVHPMFDVVPGPIAPWERP